MKNIREVLNLKHPSQSLILFLSTAVIIGIGALVYSTMVYERTLSVNNPTGISTGPAASVGGTFQPAGVAIMSLSVIPSLVIFGFLVRDSKHKDFPTEHEAPPPNPVSVPLEEPNESLQFQSSLTQKKDWEMSPTGEAPGQETSA